MKTVAIWTVNSSQVDYAYQMTRYDFLNIAQTGVVTTPQTCILKILISYLGPDTVNTEFLLGLPQYVREITRIAPGLRIDGSFPCY